MASLNGRTFETTQDICRKWRAPTKSNLNFMRYLRGSLIFSRNTTSVEIENEGNIMEVEYTKDGSVDRSGRSATKRYTGGLVSGILILFNQGLATLAFFGVGVNLVLFLTRVLQQSNAEAANNVSKWTGTVYLFSLVGAFLSDSYWGRYKTCTIFQIIFVAGLVLLSLTSSMLLITPAGCGDHFTPCRTPSTLGEALFYLSIYLIALGNGGYQPTIATFGADQFDGEDSRERHSKKAFFSYFYLALNLGSLFSNTILVYFEDMGMWNMGFWVSSSSALLALVLFLAGTKRYRHFKPSGNPLPRVAQVLVAAVRKWEVAAPTNGEDLYELDGKESIIGSKKILHSDQYRFLDKAATITEADGHFHSAKHPDPWHLCTVTQVEEVKSVLRLLPIWLCTIMYSVAFTQMASLYVEQGDKMSTGTHFRIPAASMSAFDIISVAFHILLYRRVLTPLFSRENYRGLSELVRMGIGLALAALAMIAAGLVEWCRLTRVPQSTSIFWQVPQYCIVGASEVFMYVGQLEFFSRQAPAGLKSFGSALCMASISFGNYMSSILVAVVAKITGGRNRPGWIAEELDDGRLDRFFFLVAAMVTADLVLYVVLARRYKYMEVEEEREEDEEEMLGRVRAS
ncbi:hypothetical protein AMTRI_Chr03g138670 [Amborella trichopoda]